MRKKIVGLILALTMVTAIAPYSASASRRDGDEHRIDEEDMLRESLNGWNYHLDKVTGTLIWGEPEDAATTEAVVPSELGGYTVTRISGWFFNSGTTVNLASITLPETITSIGKYAFNGRTKLEQITIPDSVQAIEDNAFNGCSSLAEINLPDHDMDIGYDVLKGTAYANDESNWENNALYIGSWLIDVREGYDGSIKAGTKYVANGIAKRMHELDITDISSSSEYIVVDDGVLYNADKTRLIYCPNDRTEYDVLDGTAKIAPYAFYLSDKLTNVHFPETVRVIGDYAFGGYINGKRTNTEVNIPSQIEYIGEWAFRGIAGPKELKSTELKYVGTGAFSGCENLTEITIPEGIEHIGSSAFVNCENLAGTLIIPGSLEFVGHRAFQGCVSLSEVILEEGVKELEYTFEGCNGLTSVTIPDSMERMDWAFLHCTSLTEARIPANTVSAHGTFDGCQNLKKVTIEEGIQEIYWTFGDCTSLTEITIPNSVTRIDIYSFSNCTNLKEITIPKSLESVRFMAFYGCSALSDVYYGGSEEDWSNIYFDPRGSDGIYREDRTKADCPLFNATVHYTDGSETPGDATRVSLSNAQAKPGDSFDVTVNLSNNTGFADLGIEIGYDSSALTLTEVKNNTEVGATYTPAQSLAANPYNMGWASTSDTDFNGTLATLTFTVNENAADGEYPITVSYYKGIGGGYKDGVDVNYDEDYNSLGIAYMSGSVTVSTHVAGDIGGDGVLNSQDGTLLLRHLAGWNVGVDNGALDVNGDGVVNNRDATTLLRYLAGWDIAIY